jgi:hypothetical protein
MYQISDIYNKDLTRKPIGALINIHILHQRRDQITGIEQKKSRIKKKKQTMVNRVNLNLKNRQIAALAQTFLKSNNPIKYGENAVTSKSS